MKFFAVLLAIVALVSSAVALKNDICGLDHSLTGDAQRQCRALIPQWSYNAAAKECVFFNYGGCGRNDNRFKSKEDCEKMCKE